MKCRTQLCLLGNLFEDGTTDFFSRNHVLKIWKYIALNAIQDTNCYLNRCSNFSEQVYISTGHNIIAGSFDCKSTLNFPFKW